MPKLLKRVKRFLRLFLCCVKMQTTTDDRIPGQEELDSSLVKSTKFSPPSTEQILNQSKPEEHQLTLRRKLFRRLSRIVHPQPSQINKVYKLDPRHLAEELTLQDAQMFTRIDLSELKNGAWTKKDKVYIKLLYRFYILFVV